MNKIGLGAFLIVALMLVGAGFYIKGLLRDISTYRQNAQSYQESIKAKDEAFAELEEAKNDLEQLYLSAQKADQDRDTQIEQRNKETRRIINEDQAAREWANTVMPDSFYERLLRTESN